MKTSERKRDANRRNALSSTGPRGVEGKAVSRFNALRHGMTARAVLVPGEDPAELDAFEASVRQALAPVGALEALLVDRVVSLAWRLRRAAAVDAGLFARALFAVEAQRQAREKARRRATWAVEWKAAMDELGELEKSWGSVKGGWGPGKDWTDEQDRRWEELDAAKGKLMAERERLGWEPTLFEKNPGLFEDERERVLIAGRAEPATPPPEEEGSAALASSFTAGDGAGAVLFERLARYEGTLSREMFRALHELERLQARRDGAHVPPPAVLDVDLAVSAVGGEA